MNSSMERTTKIDQKLALSSLKAFVDLTKNLNNSRNGVKIKVQETGEFMTIPKKALVLLYEIIRNMSQGKSITLIPSDSEVSTQQAAEMLRVSRPHLVKLLEEGKIPFKKIGSHRRIFLADLLAYDAKQKTEREKQLDFLANQAQKLNLGYE
jgi:excisionase family DNA binding protein